MSPLFNKVIIIGVGLIGSSIGMNLVKKRLAREVIGVGHHRANLREAIRRRAIQRGVGVQQAIPLLEKLSAGDLVILAAPVRENLRYLNLVSKKTVVMDVGSTKGTIVRTAQRRRLHFVGSHPIAGTEKSGATAGQIDLFRKRICLLTPTPFASQREIAKIRRLWRELGSETLFVAAARHDRLLAAVSHLPHVVVYSLVAAVSRLVSPREGFRFALGGLKGTTRIAASSPEMWRDIFLDNRRDILQALQRYEKEFLRLKNFIRRGKAAPLLRFLEEARQFRLKIN